MNNIKKYNKQFLRNRISKGASYTEIYLSGLILLGILILSITVVKDIYYMGVSVITDTKILDVEIFLSHALELIIGIEFVKMISKHTPGSAVEVLLFAIARKLITSHGNMIDSLIGVVSIAILFVIRKYLSNLEQKINEEEIIVNGGTSITELKENLGIDVGTSCGNTVAGIVANIAKNNNARLEPGYEVQIANRIFQIYSMDEELIKQIKIITIPSKIK